LARMVDQAWRATYGSILPERFWDAYPVDQRMSELRKSIADPSQHGVVAEADGSLVGWALRGPSRADDALIRPARRRELYSLYVAAPGVGLGQRLLDEVLGGEPAELWVFEANVRAQRFYERNGFRPEGTRHVYRPDIANLAEVRLVR
jgi:ribosomal protein S18 acetylase RimI-like enzyme